jgi:hypothetical protein
LGAETAPWEAVKKLAEMRWAGGTACPAIENNALALVAQAVPPAICDFFHSSLRSNGTAPPNRFSPPGLRLEVMDCTLRIDWQFNNYHCDF